MFSWLFGRKKKTVWLVDNARSGNKPVKTFVFGQVETAVWLNQYGSDELEFRLSFSRLVNGTRTKSFGVSDMDDLYRGATRAIAWAQKGIKVVTH